MHHGLLYSWIFFLAARAYTYTRVIGINLKQKYSRNVTPLTQDALFYEPGSFRTDTSFKP